MVKEEVLAQINAAKEAHVKWVRYADLLINGVEIKKEAIPVDYTSCKFGTWFYANKEMLLQIRNCPPSVIEKIEFLHEKLHMIYFRIFNIFFDNKEKGLIGKLFSREYKKVTKDGFETAEKSFLDLKKISEQLLKEIDVLTQIIQANR